MRSAKMSPPPCLPFDCFIQFSTGPIRGRPLPKTDERIESRDTITVVCQRYLLNLHASKIDQYKASTAPNMSDVLVTGAIEIAKDRGGYQSVHIYYTGPPIEPPLLEPHELPFATVVTLVVTYVKPSAYHAPSLQIIPLQGVVPKLLETRGTTQRAEEQLEGAESSYPPCMPDHHVLDLESELKAEKQAFWQARRAVTKPQRFSNIFYMLRTFLSV